MSYGCRVAERGPVEIERPSVPDDGRRDRVDDDGRRVVGRGIDRRSVVGRRRVVVGRVWMAGVGVNAVSMGVIAYACRRTGPVLGWHCVGVRSFVVVGV